MDMQVSKHFFINRERGVSLTGLILVLALLGMLLVLGFRVVPSLLEYHAIKNAIASARASGASPPEMRKAFDRSAQVNYIETISGRDLVISKETGVTEISFDYEKRIPLAGNVSLVIDYSGTTDKSGAAAEKPATAAR
jgi:hypothetical protein